MRIAYLVNQYPSLSHTFIRREIEALERRGVDVLRFAIRFGETGSLGEEDRRETSQTRRLVGSRPTDLLGSLIEGFTMAPLRALRASLNALGMGAKSEAGLVRHAIYFLEAMVVAAWVRKAGAHHLHAHFGTNSATVGMLAADIAGVSFSFTVHGPEEFDKPALIHLPAKIRAAAFVVGVSNFGQSQLRRLTPIEAWSKITVVRCGVEPGYADGAPPDAPPSYAPHLVSVGRLVEQKGQAGLIEAIALLKRSGRMATLTLVGDGEMRSVLEALAAAMGVADQIHFAGWKSPAEVRALVSGARAFVLPSYAEGLPVSIMEAMLLGKPVVSTYIAGIPELVENGVNGWLCPAGDAAALASAIAAVLDAEPGTLAAMGEHGRRKALVRHNADIEAATLAAAFADAIAGAARARAPAHVGLVAAEAAK